MYGGHYFGRRYYGSRFFGDGPVLHIGPYIGNHYFGRRYYGHRYFSTSLRDTNIAISVTNTLATTGVTGLGGTSFTYSADKSIAQSATLGLNGVTGISGDFLYENINFSITPPLDITLLNGAVTVIGNVQYAVSGPAVKGGYWGRRYFGQRFYGPRYFGTVAAYPMVATATTTLNGTFVVAGSVGVDISVIPSSAIPITATLGLGPTFISYSSDIILVQTSDLGLNATVAVAMAEDGFRFKHKGWDRIVSTSDPNWTPIDTTQN